MKKLWYLTMLACMGLGACENDSKEVPPAIIQPPELSVSTIAGKYWFTDAYFVFIANGEEQVSPSDIRSIKMGGGESDNFFYTFSPFYCSPEGKIDKYDLDLNYEPDRERLKAWRGIFNLYVSPDERTLRLIPNDRRFAGKCIYCDVELRVRSVKPERIEFDMPMNDVVRKDWSKYIVLQNTTGLRVVWRLMTDEQKERYQNFESPIEMPLEPIQ